MRVSSSAESSEMGHDEDEDVVVGAGLVGLEFMVAVEVIAVVPDEIKGSKGYRDDVIDWKESRDWMWIHLSLLFLNETTKRLSSTLLLFLAFILSTLQDKSNPSILTPYLWYKTCLLYLKVRDSYSRFVVDKDFDSHNQASSIFTQSLLYSMPYTSSGISRGATLMNN